MIKGTQLSQFFSACTFDLYIYMQLLIVHSSKPNMKFVRVFVIYILTLWETFLMFYTTLCMHIAYLVHQMRFGETARTYLVLIAARPIISICGPSANVISNEI